jgi:predicted transcriptional regulator
VAKLANKNSKTIGKSMEETKEYHTRYLRAINSPVRRNILRAIKGGTSTFKELKAVTGLNAESLCWHLNILERGFCIEKEVNENQLIYKLTQEGLVVDYMDR